MSGQVVTARFTTAYRKSCITVTINKWGKKDKLYPQLDGIIDKVLGYSVILTVRKLIAKFGCECGSQMSNIGPRAEPGSLTRACPVLHGFHQGV